MNAIPYDCPEVRHLTKHAEAADKVAANAARWFTELADARAAHAAALARFTETLTPPNARNLADAAAKVRDLTEAVGAIEAEGGPDAFRRAALIAPEVFALFADGFRRRLDALAGLRTSALKLLSVRRAEATEAGAAHPLIADQTPACQEAALAYDNVENAMQSARVVIGYADAKGIGHELRKFAELFALLTAPLPVLPAGDGK